jgi:hypothetical protein
MDQTAAVRLQLERQVSHWEAATEGLRRPDDFASETAWRSVEEYLNRAVRTSLRGSTNRLQAEITGLRAQLRAASTLAHYTEVERRLQRFRRLYTQVETVVGFFGEAVNTRTNPRLGAHLRTLDRLAERSMQGVLGRLGRAAPPVLTYVDKGLGASILRAGIRLWDGELSPAAAIKITRHNLFRPTSLIHETGHQVAHLLGWNDEAGAAILRGLGADPALATVWASWVSESTADAFAFAHTGYASVVALHDVVANEIETVLRLLPGDPHPVAYIRVLLGAEMCRRFYGTGPWDELATAWTLTHPLTNADSTVAAVLARSVSKLPQIVDILLTHPMRSLGGHCLAQLVEPERVNPLALERLSIAAGPSLYTSPHWASSEPLRITALTGLRIALDPSRTTEYTEQFRQFSTTWSASTPANIAA